MRCHALRNLQPSSRFPVAALAKRTTRIPLERLTSLISIPRFRRWTTSDRKQESRRRDILFFGVRLRTGVTANEESLERASAPAMNRTLIPAIAIDGFINYVRTRELISSSPGHVEKTKILSSVGTGGALGSRVSFRTSPKVNFVER